MVNPNLELERLRFDYEEKLTWHKAKGRIVEKLLEEKIRESGLQIQSKVTNLENTERAMLNILADARELEKNLASERNKIKTILYGIGDGVFVVNNDLKIILWNKVAEEISGFLTQDVLGKKYDETLKFINEKTGGVNDAFVKSAMATGHIQQMSNHTLLTKKDGSRIAIADSSAPLKDKNGDIIGCVVIFRDATKEREIDRMKTEFVSIASHQLRTPLTAIKLSLEMLADNSTGKLNADQKDYLDNIQQSAQGMTSLVNDLLNISRLETGKIQINPKPVNLKELINKILVDFHIISSAHNCKISFRIAPKLAPEINTDPDLIRQAIHNLVSNAIQYSSPSDKNRIDIAINRAEDKDHLIISVKDTGIGIPENAQKRIFEKFFRAENAIKAKVGGTGLGLYIVKMIIENLGGKIWFDSAMGTGTTFYVKMPINPPPPRLKRIHEYKK